MAEPNVPANFNALYNVGARATRGVRGPAKPAARRAVERLAAQVPAVDVDLDEATRNPIRMGVNEPRARLSPERAGSPEEAAKAFVRERADLWQLNDQDVAPSRSCRSASGPADGSHDPEGRRRRGVPVGHDRSGQRRTTGGVGCRAALSGPPAPSRPAPRPAPSRRAAATAPSRRATCRPRRRSPGRRPTYRAIPISRATSSRRRGAADSGAYRFYAPKWKTASSGKPRRKRAARSANPDRQRRSFERPVRVKDVLFPMGEGQFVPGYFIELWIRGLSGVQLRDRRGRRARRAVPQEPDFARRRSSTACTTPATRCSARRTARLPGRRTRPACPTASRRRPIAEKLIEIESLLPGPALAAAECDHDTRGNNCIAYRRPEAAPTASARATSIGKVTAPRTFDAQVRPLQAGDDSGNLQNSLVGMFFHVNWLHDRWYEAGFDEASGNAQKDNFGLGGHRRRPDPGRGQRLQRHRQRQHVDPAGRRRARACRCSASTAPTRCPAAPATTRR